VEAQCCLFAVLFFAGLTLVRLVPLPPPTADALLLWCLLMTLLLWLLRSQLRLPGLAQVRPAHHRIPALADRSGRGSRLPGLLHLTCHGRPARAARAGAARRDLAQPRAVLRAYDVEPVPLPVQRRPASASRPHRTRPRRG
jgi:hypothetical protein